MRYELRIYHRRVEEGPLESPVYWVNDNINQVTSWYQTKSSGISKCFDNILNNQISAFDFDGTVFAEADSIEELKLKVPYLFL